MRLAALVLLASALLALVGWQARSHFIRSYGLIDPDVLFRALPDTPARDRSAPQDSRYFDKFGYLVADETRVAIATSSKRPARADDPYDVDITVRVLILSTDAAARRTFRIEGERERRLMRALAFMPNGPALRAQEASAWRFQTSSDSPVYVVQARYGNYVLRYIGRIAKDGYFPTERAFFDAVHQLDAHVLASLQNAT